MLPDVPTVAETVPGYEMTVWYGAFGPPGMPNDIVTKLNSEIARALFLPEVKTRMADIAVEVASSTPEELGERMRRDVREMGRHRQGHRDHAAVIIRLSPRFKPKYSADPCGDGQAGARPRGIRGAGALL